MTMEVVNEIRDVLNVGTNNKEMEADEELEQSNFKSARKFPCGLDYLLIRKRTPSDWPVDFFMQLGILRTTTYVLLHVSHLSSTE